MGLTQDEKQEIADLIINGMHERGMCSSFDKATRETVHILHRARVESGVSHSDIVTVYQWGKSLEGGFKKMINIFGITVLFIVFMLAMKLIGVWEIVKILAAGKGQ